jgi:hypothetical protein
MSDGPTSHKGSQVPSAHEPTSDTPAATKPSKMSSQDELFGAQDLMQALICAVEDGRVLTS